ncbi:MAG: hypothetical protein C0595_03655 [Marinilabiliales bacterium]|nr:MAG: hypothetical protein C0595_03655 [Marinilabiliales bacterium]
MSTNNKYRITYILGAITILLLVNACSTKKNTWTRRAYHNLTSHYNVYWNGMMSLQEGEKSFKDTFEDDYSKVLPVYNYGDKKQAQRLNPKMDRTIKKASIGIQKHSMYFGGKEQVKWIDDSYLMMGKAHFYKHDYISARRVFDYVAKTYQENPIHYEAYLWLAKTHLQNERFEKAIATINLLQSKMEEKDFPFYVEKQIPLVLANFYIEQEKYEEAFPYLERSLELNNAKEITTRVKFILGQLYQREGNLERATEYFTSVVKKNPDYVMAFEAKMHLAETYASENGDSKDINKILNKMLKEARNKEFRDQIYYALAEVAKKDGNDTLAIKYLRNSVMFSVKNQVQKTKSSLEVADMFFERNNYVYAQAYYDTAVSSLTRDYPEYEEISRKASVLTDLVTQAQIIKEQDSLQYLVSLDTTELYALIDKKIEEYKLEQEKKQEEEDLAEGGTQFVDMNGRGRSGNSLGNGEWYFYNTAAISSGYNEFTKKWGNRRLEDNWRLSNKKVITQNEDDIVANDTISDSTLTKNSSPIDRSYYLAGLPNTPEKIQASDEQLIEAYNKLGFIYLMKLNDSLRALDTYLDFQKRFPENQYRLESWYALYKIYNAENNEKEAEFYKNLILGNYPESTYAKVIINPDYYALLEEEKQKASELYMRTYDAFKAEKYFRVISYSNKGIELYPEDTSLMPKFMYLKALSLGKVDTPDTLYASLDSLLVTYPRSSVAPRAKALKSKLQQEYGIGVSENAQTKPSDLKAGETIEKSIYNFNGNDLHFVMLIVDNEKVEINPLKIRLSDFNNKYFSLMRLKVKSLLLNKTQTIITVGNFKNKDEALNYYNAINIDKYVLSGLDEENYSIYPISTSNYPLFYREKNIKAYKDFFEKFYKRD